MITNIIYEYTIYLAIEAFTWASVQSLQLFKKEVEAIKAAHWLSQKTAEQEHYLGKNHWQQRIPTQLCGLGGIWEDEGVKYPPLSLPELTNDNGLSITIMHSAILGKPGDLKALIELFKSRGRDCEMTFFSSYMYGGVTLGKGYHAIRPFSLAAKYQMSTNLGVLYRVYSSYLYKSSKLLMQKLQKTTKNDRSILNCYFDDVLSNVMTQAKKCSSWSNSIKYHEIIRRLKSYHNNLKEEGEGYIPLLKIKSFLEGPEGATPLSKAEYRQCLMMVLRNIFGFDANSGDESVIKKLGQDNQVDALKMLIPETQHSWKNNNENISLWRKQDELDRNDINCHHVYSRSSSR